VAAPPPHPSTGRNSWRSEDQGTNSPSLGSPRTSFSDLEGAVDSAGTLLCPAVIVRPMSVRRRLPGFLDLDPASCSAQCWRAAQNAERRTQNTDQSNVCARYDGSILLQAAQSSDAQVARIWRWRDGDSTKVGEGWPSARTKLWPPER
jgi:hypothetical protein